MELASLAEGTRVGGYVVEARIGVGGFGEVFRARDGFARLGKFREPRRQQAIRWLAEH